MKNLKSNFDNLINFDNKKLSQKKRLAIYHYLCKFTDVNMKIPNKTKEAQKSKFSIFTQLI